MLAQHICASSVLIATNASLLLGGGSVAPATTVSQHLLHCSCFISLAAVAVAHATALTAAALLLIL